MGEGVNVSVGVKLGVSEGVVVWVAVSVAVGVSLGVWVWVAVRVIVGSGGVMEGVKEGKGVAIIDVTMTVLVWLGTAVRDGVGVGRNLKFTVIRPAQ